MLSDPTHSRGARLLEWLLLSSGVICLTWYGWTMHSIHERQAAASAAVERMLSTPAAPTERPLPPPAPGSIIGRLDIPRLHISAPVEAGEGDDVLDFAVGYLADTPLPWLSGNSAFAAHRDRLFRPLEHIRAGDSVWLSTEHGDLEYQVIRTLIVKPEDVWVVGPVPNVDLTLITCFPFQYVGHAPKRFIVQAEKVETPAI
jgi:sortase A